MNSIVSVPACFSNLGQAAKFVAHWFGPYQLIHPNFVFVYQYFPCSFLFDMVFHWLHCECFFFEVYAWKLVCAYVYLYLSVVSTWNILGAFLKVVTCLTFLVSDLLLYLCILNISTLMSLFFPHSWGHMGLRFWRICFYFPNSNFWQHSFLLV